MKITIAVFLAFMVFAPIAYAKPSGTYTHGYVKRKSGKYVNGYHHTRPNHTKRDNYSSKGNVNPYTGKRGTVDPNR